MRRIQTRNEATAAEPVFHARHLPAALERFRAMIDNHRFAVLAPVGLFKQWVHDTEWLLRRQENCTSAAAAAAMFDLHAATNADIEQFIEQINVLLEEGREYPELAVVARAMIVGLAVTLRNSAARKAVENAVLRQ
jgi:hypothetical protein